MWGSTDFRLNDGLKEGLIGSTTPFMPNTSLSGRWVEEASSEFSDTPSFWGMPAGVKGGLPAVGESAGSCKEKAIRYPVPGWYLITDCAWHRCRCQAKHGGTPQPTLGGHSGRCKESCKHRDETSAVLSYSVSFLPPCLPDLWVSAVNLKFISLPFISAERLVKNWAIKLSQILKEGNCTGHILPVQHH